MVVGTVGPKEGYPVAGMALGQVHRRYGRVPQLPGGRPETPDPLVLKLWGLLCLWPCCLPSGCYGPPHCVDVLCAGTVLGLGCWKSTKPGKKVNHFSRFHKSRMKSIDSQTSSRLYQIHF
jgi:hypothetical protein